MFRCGFASAYQRVRRVRRRLSPPRCGGWHASPPQHRSRSAGCCAGRTQLGQASSQATDIYIVQRVRLPCFAQAGLGRQRPSSCKLTARFSRLKERLLVSSYVLTTTGTPCRMPMVTLPCPPAMLSMSSAWGGEPAEWTACDGGAVGPRGGSSVAHASRGWHGKTPRPAEGDASITMRCCLNALAQLLALQLQPCQHGDGVWRGQTHARLSFPAGGRLAGTHWSLKAHRHP